MATTVRTMRKANFVSSCQQNGPTGTRGSGYIKLVRPAAALIGEGPVQEPGGIRAALIRRRHLRGPPIGEPGPVQPIADAREGIMQFFGTSGCRWRLPPEQTLQDCGRLCELARPGK